MAALVGHPPNVLFCSNIDIKMGNFILHLQVVSYLLHFLGFSITRDLRIRFSIYAVVHINVGANMIRVSCLVK